MQLSRNQIGGLIIGFLVLGLLVHILIENTNAPKTYSGNGISFNYPANWTISFPDTSGTYTTSSIIVSKYNIMSGPQLQINSMPSSMSTQDVINSGQNFRIPGGSIISNGTLQIDGNTAYQITYVDHNNGPNRNMRFEQIGFVKNGKIYSFLLQAPDIYFDNETSNFNMILNSFKVQ